jgi:catechol 2,3-dioxygenase-like lactoylglutathione lyase family enzyme
MIAHIGLIVSDIERGKKFYAAALKPIGYQMLREYDITPNPPKRRLRRAAACRSVALSGRSWEGDYAHRFSSEQTHDG